MDTIQYGDFKLQKAQPGMLITHAKIPMTFTVDLDNYLLPQAIALAIASGQSVNQLHKEIAHKSDLLGLFYSLEYATVTTRSLIFISAWWASANLSRLEKLCRISYKAGHLEGFLERIKQQHPGIYCNAALMDRVAFAKKGLAYELNEEKFMVP